MVSAKRHLPTELRVRIYTYFVPSNNDGIVFGNLRLVSRLIKDEYDYEVKQDITKYMSLLPARHGAAYPVRIAPPQVFRDTQVLRVHLPFKAGSRDISAAKSLVKELLTQLIPHIRRLEICFYTETIISDSEGPAPPQNPTTIVRRVCGEVKQYFVNDVTRFYNHGSLRNKGICEVLVEWDGLVNDENANTLNFHLPHWSDLTSDYLEVKQFKTSDGILSGVECKVRRSWRAGQVGLIAVGVLVILMLALGVTALWHIWTLLSAVSLLFKVPLANYLIAALVVSWVFLKMGSSIMEGLR